MNLDDVKPCPFCGKKVGIETWEDEENEGLLAHCEGDELEEGCDFYFSLPEWNNRPIEDALKQQTAALVAALEAWADVEKIAKEYDTQINLFTDGRVQVRVDRWGHFGYETFITEIADNLPEVMRLTKQALAAVSSETAEKQGSEREG